jgi:hypothetical protein
MDLNTFEKYKTAVIQAYQKKKQEGKLPPNLERHTPANLRNECLEVFHVRFNDKDANTFKSFYGERRNAEEYFQKIKISSSDKFKPLDNYLKGTTGDTKEKNIHLLAWLIDFDQRPFISGDPYKLLLPTTDPVRNPQGPLSTLQPITDDEIDYDDVGKDEIGKGEEAATHGTLAESPVDEKTNPIDEKINKRETATQELLLSRRIRIKNKFITICKPITDRPRSFFAGLVIMASVLLLYFLSRPKRMFWDKNEYKTISFFDYVIGAFSVPIDTLQLNNQKKIIDWSMITRNSIGKVYYSKINKKVEFYTIGGTNPEDTTRRLLPLTEYMYEKYIANKFRKN